MALTAVIVILMFYAAKAKLVLPDGAQVELSHHSNSWLRVSVSYSGAPVQISTPMLSNPQNSGPARESTTDMGDGWHALTVNGLGSVAVNVVTGGLRLANAAGVLSVFTASNFSTLHRDQSYATQTCDMPYDERADCGYAGITEDECVNQRHCCWEESPQPNPEGYPWCFSTTPSEPPSTVMVNLGRPDAVTKLAPRYYGSGGGGDRSAQAQRRIGAGARTEHDLSHAVLLLHRLVRRLRRLRGLRSSKHT